MVRRKTFRSAHLLTSHTMPLLLLLTLTPLGEREKGSGGEKRKGMKEEKKNLYMWKHVYPKSQLLRTVGWIQGCHRWPMQLRCSSILPISFQILTPEDRGILGNLVWPKGGNRRNAFKLIQPTEYLQTVGQDTGLWEYRDYDKCLLQGVPHLVVKICNHWIPQNTVYAIYPP